MKKPAVLVIDAGGTNIKLLAAGQGSPRKISSGPGMTASRMVRAVLRAARDWRYDRVSIGYPGPVVNGRPISEPRHLGPGWVGFDFQKSFGRPVKIVNDAAMQALGCYRGGRMLFLGLGTGLGSAMVIDGTLAPMELGDLPYKKGQSVEDYAGLAGLDRLGKRKWRRTVNDIVEVLKSALQAEYVVLGGGNAKLLKDLPPATRLGDNSNAFKGGTLLWGGQYESG